MNTYRLIVGDCRERLREMDAESVDAVVCDPPYDLLSVSRNGSPRVENPASPAGRATARGGFMGLTWDATGVAFDPATWAEVLRVLKPGGHLVAFGGTRTYHRMACAIEDAGFEIRDSLAWLYGSGFPKSKNLDGNWDGWGSALKPAHEPIVLARKPLSESSIAANVARWGTGALNIDACRVDGHGNTRRVHLPGTRSREQYRTGVSAGAAIPTTLGRWPANVILDEEAARLLDAEAGERISHGGAVTLEHAPMGYGGNRRRGSERENPGSRGGASRFYFTAKPDRRERDAGLESLPLGTRNRVNPGGLENDPKWGPVQARNTHPTVKPLALMSWLCRLVTPPGGLVLDPFCGSGSTGVAAICEGFRFVGIEREPEYAEIAEARLANAAPLLARGEVERAPEPEDLQGDLFAEAAP